jgi:hypothetical protein
VIDFEVHVEDVDTLSSGRAVWIRSRAGTTLEDPHLDLVTGGRTDEPTSGHDAATTRARRSNRSRIASASRARFTQAPRLKDDSNSTARSSLMPANARAYSPTIASPRIVCCAVS